MVQVMFTDISYLEGLDEALLFCQAEPLCNFGRGHLEEQL